LFFVVQKSVPECQVTSYVEKVSCRSSSAKGVNVKEFTRRYAVCSHHF